MFRPPFASLGQPHPAKEFVVAAAEALPFNGRIDDALVDPEAFTDLDRSSLGPVAMPAAGLRERSR